MKTLYIVATPIGNMEDITLRAVRILFAVDHIICEDTRRTGQLIKNLELSIRNKELSIKNININNIPKLISYYDEIEEKRTPEIIHLLEQGNDIALVSDSGTPLISDPGYKLVREAVKRNIKVVSIPGPSSVLTALVSSGLPPDQFLFLGYLPPKETKRNKLLKELKLLIQFPIIHPTIIFFETPHRLVKSLKDILEVYGDIDIVICRELTKIHEEVWKGKISKAITDFQNPKGEFVLLFTI